MFFWFLFYELILKKYTHRRGIVIVELAILNGYNKNNEKKYRYNNAYCKE